MLIILRELLAPPIFPNDKEKTRAAELLNLILLALMAMGFVALLVFLPGGVAPIPIYLAITGFILLLIILRIPMRRGYILPVSYIVVILFNAVITFAIIVGGTIRAPGITLFTVTILISGLIIGRRAAYFTAVINTLIFVVLTWLEVNGWLPEPITAVNLRQGIIFALDSLLVAALLGLALRRINESLDQARLGEEKLATLNTELERRVEERTAELGESARQIQKRVEQLEAIANVARSSATTQNLSALLTSIAEEVSLRFGFYHVGIFLLDENREYAKLIASNSEGGLNMLTQGHQLKVGEQGMVGYVTFQGQLRIARNVGDEAIFFNNPNLPATQSEITLPLKFGQDIIGALDIQSTEQDGFSQENLKIFSVLADQVSVAIQNTRSLEQAKWALREAEAASSKLTGRAWKMYSDSLPLKGYRYDGIKLEPLRPFEKNPNEKEALFIPVQLRGQIIGRLKLKPTDGDRNWTEDERAIIESVAERVAIALESARLLEDAQKRASREAFLSEISAKFSGSFQLDSILRDAVEELGQSFKGSTVSFQLINPSAPPSAVPSNDATAVQRKWSSK